VEGKILSGDSLVTMPLLQHSQSQVLRICYLLFDLPVLANRNLTQLPLEGCEILESRADRVYS
jgi:hypothetical protein